MDLTFPIEFNVHGTPVSLQAKRARSKEAWKEKIRAASGSAIPIGHFATERPVALTLYYFTAVPRTGDIDNILKPTLDALIKHVYMNDGQVERIVAQKFKPDEVYPFSAPSPVLATALQSGRPLVYIRISDDPFEDLT